MAIVYHILYSGLTNFFHRLYHLRQRTWNDRVVGPGCGRGCQEFWHQLRGSEFLKQHPFMPPEIWSKTIPIGFHGDGGGFNKHDSLYGLSWNSLVSDGRTMDTRFLFTVMKKSDMVPDSLNTLLRAFSWSMKVLLSGQSPHTNWLGAPMAGGGVDLADGWRGCMVQVRGDWQFYCQIFGFPQWNSADIMCPFCQASSTFVGRSWTDCSPGAGWRATKWTHKGYMAHLAHGGQPIPIFLVPMGFWDSDSKISWSTYCTL